MKNEQDKGYVIATFPGIGGASKNKNALFACLPYLIFIIMPLYLITAYYSPKFENDQNLVLYAMLPAMLIMSVFFFFMMDWVATRLRMPITVYSNGIENKCGYVERMKHRPCFIPRSLIKGIEIEDSVHTPEKGRTFYRTVVKVNMTDGRTISLPGRDTERMKGFKESMARLNIDLIEKKPTAHKIPVAVPSPNSTIDVPSTDGNNFCGGCGTRLLEGAAFCGKCGRKV